MNVRGRVLSWRRIGLRQVQRSSTLHGEKRKWDAAEKKNTLSMSRKDGFLQQNWRMVVVYSYGACEVAGASLSICCCWQALSICWTTPGHSELCNDGGVHFWQHIGAWDMFILYLHLRCA